MTTHPDLNDIARDDATAGAIARRIASGGNVGPDFLAGVDAALGGDPNLAHDPVAVFRQAEEYAAERAATRAEGKRLLADPRVKGREAFAITAWEGGMTVEAVLALCETLPVVGAPADVFARQVADTSASWSDVAAKMNRRH